MDRDESVKFAKEYLENIISFFDVNVDVAADENDGIITLSVPSTSVNSILIGRGAETLRSLQYLISTTLRQKNADIQRVNLDIADYKKQRADKIATQARGWIDRVLETGHAYTAHLGAADRFVVHGVAAEYEGIQTHSEGEGRDRVLIIEKK